VRVIESGGLIVVPGRQKSSSRQMALLIPRLKWFERGERATYWWPVHRLWAEGDDCGEIASNDRSGLEADVGS
jgi:hypothetical protein